MWLIAVGAHQTAHLDQSHLVCFIFIDVKASIALGCALNQVNQDLDSTRLHTNSSVVPLMRMRNGTNSSLNAKNHIIWGHYADIYV